MQWGSKHEPRVSEEDTLPTPPRPTWPIWTPTWNLEFYFTCFKHKWLLNSEFIILTFLVGYDDRRMKLDGVFYYDSESQRALPFSVDIRELSEENKVFIGSTSKY